MFACRSCFEVEPFVSSVTSDRRSEERFHCDPLWHSIRNEAREEADREPLLRKSMQVRVTAHRTIADGLSRHLAETLADENTDAVDLESEFAELYAGDRRLAESARRDLLAISVNDPATKSLLHPFLNFKGFHAVQGYRLSHALWRADRHALAYFIQRRVSEVDGVDIHPAARIGSGVFVDHGTGVVIGETAVVGDDVTILHGVTLGGTGNQSGDRHPKVGPGVFIGAGAQLLGNISIGERAKIGASSVVLRDVPEQATVAGVPAKVVRREGDAKAAA